jgi:hypothetical protein
MAMQYDVKSVHMQTSGVAVNYRTRLKGSIISANAAAAARNVVYANNSTQTSTYNIPGSTVCTVTIVNHGLATGDRVWLNFTTGSGATNNVYVVTKVTADTFTVTTASLTTNGNVTMYATILMEVDSYNAAAFTAFIPGEGILAENGIYVGLVANLSTTVFYG